MSSDMDRRTKIMTALLALLLLLFAGGAVTYFSLQNKIAKRLEKGWVLTPLELYSQGFALSVGRVFPLDSVRAELDHRNLRAERDYILGDADGCARLTGLTFKPEFKKCLWLKKNEGETQLIFWDEHNVIQEMWTGEPLAVVPSLALFPRLITQFFDGQPILQQTTPLGEVPLACLQGVTAIEDREFLEHGGVSATGTMRALVRNLRAGRWAEGGSTITQQLVKNFFLTSKKTLRRKIEEQALAIMLESQLSKDQILEMYLNVIYMGQSGPYQVRGFGSAAQNYFAKPISELNTAECALLAAMINNPGRYSPFTHPPQALQRRELVLSKMSEANMLNAREFAQGKAAPLPKMSEAEKHTHAPYFVMSALKEYTSLQLEAEEGARLYTTLDPELQTLTTAAVSKIMPLIEARVKKPGRDAHQEALQVAVVTVDINSAQILSLVGGREYRTTQFNRAVDSRRQIGSIVKPFVYWPAVREHTPITEVLDEPFEWKIGRQTWKPKNFESGFLGPVPYFYALAHSMNVAAARVGQDIGIDQVISTLKSAGVEESIPNLPALTLGVLELSPLQVAQAYSTLARLGDGERLHTLLRVEDLTGKILYNNVSAEEFSLNPIPTAVVVSMMEQTVNLGTARSARAAGLEGNYAGKTGTTSDSKDAWFAGFSPRLLTVVWVGYDNNTVLGLTGAGAALPVWTELMKNAQPLFSSEDFKWPEGTETQTLKRDDLLAKFPKLKDLPDEIKLIFAK